MKLKNQLLLSVNALVITTMAGVFVFHVREQDRKLEEFRLQVQADIEETVEQAHIAYRKAQEAEARIDFLKQRDCLAANIYHEASVEGDQGKRAVAWVTLNRVVDEKYPDTICEVVYQARTDEDGDPIKGECQFSWYCDGKGDDIADMSAWNRSIMIATEVMNDWGRETDPTGDAIMYHADYVDPFWVSSYERTVQIDTHIFYKEKDNG